MGNAQKKSPGKGEEGGGTPGTGRSFRSPEPPGKKQPEVNGTHPAERAARRGEEEESQAGGDECELDAPAGALPPPLARLKQHGNRLFRHGQFGDALDKYSQAITGCQQAGVDSPDDLCILYSNRAACFLKDGNSVDCIEDCTRALELRPFSLKPLLRRAMAYESLERYRKAYVDYKTVLQIDVSVQAAHDSIHRITKMLIEQDGPDWREKLPEIPVVPLSAQHHRTHQPNTELLQARAARAEQEKVRKAEAQFSLLKHEGNQLVKNNQFQRAAEKYTQCLIIKPAECSVYTNRALCYLRLDRYEEAKLDCDSALQIEPTNKKAFYRRALAHKGLKDYLSSSSDLQEVLQLDPNVQEAEQELQEVTVLLRESLMNTQS